MLYSEKESNLVDFFRQMKNEEIGLMPHSSETERLAGLIRDPVMWTKWVDSSKKSDLPPDFYCDELLLMMEVMRVDDHGYEENGNIINPTYRREHEIEKELREEGVFDVFPNINSIIINAKTDLPTDEDHNYGYYLESFKRTVGKHIAHIPNYKINHPGYKIVFYIFDESSAYFLKTGEPIVLESQTVIPGQQHWFFADKAFVDVFIDSDIDYIIWCAPFKYLSAVGTEPIQIRAAVIDVNRYDVTPIEYNPSEIISSEK